MAKNKKEKFNYNDVKINEEELSITKIGEITTANQSPVLIFIIVGILLVFIFFLPNLVELINNKGETPITGTPSGSSSNKDNPNKDKETEYYNFNKDLIVNLEENIVIKNFNLSNNTLSFSIINNSNTKFDLGKDNYFIELYTDDLTLLERIILSDIAVLKETTYEFKYNCLKSTTSNLKKITFVKKDVADYPNIILEKNENNEEILTCFNNNETLTYKFLNSKLSSISDNFKYDNSNSDYQSIYDFWKNNTNNLNNIEGITAMFVDTQTNFAANVLLDLENVNAKDLKNTYYYKYQTDAKIIKFEMESRGFSCK